MVAIAALGLAAYVWFFFLPNRRTMQQISAEIDAKRAYALTGPRVQSDILRTQSEAIEQSQYVERWQGTSATSSDVAQLFATLADTMRQTGVQTTRFAPESRVTYDHLQRLMLRVGCRGSYQQIVSLLAAWEKLPERIWIEELNVEFPENAGDKSDKSSDKSKGSLQCEISLAIFAVKSNKID